MHGAYWSLPLKGDYLLVPIPVLEFIAAIASLFTFTSLLPKLDPNIHVIHLRVDALATPLILTEDAAKSPSLVALHSMVLEEERFQQLVPFLAASHVYGMANELADAASRSDMPRLFRLAAQLRTSPVQVQHDLFTYSLLECALKYLPP